ncbi:MAG: 50S ribosomal protein L37ae [Thermoplasmata archaeon]
MSKRTKKVGATGWMGPRYGIRIRRRVLEISHNMERPAGCPRCSTMTMHRVASGIFECRRCGVRFASNAYIFEAPPAITRAEVKEAAPGNA